MTTETEFRIMALAEVLEISTDQITETDWPENSFKINSRRKKQGEPPIHYFEIIRNFKKLLTTLKKNQIELFIQNEVNPKEERDKLYYTISRYLKRYQTKKPEYAAIKEKTLYVENVLYHLLCDEDKDFVRNYQDAFLGKVIEDKREWRQVNDGEYLVLTDKEADEMAKEYIESSLWAFNSWFIIEHSQLPHEAGEMISSFQENECEGANETILALIDDIDEFVKAAIDADGRAHFLNTYDGEESETEINGETLYIYRTN